MQRFRMVATVADSVFSACPEAKEPAKNQQQHDPFVVVPDEYDDEPAITTTEREDEGINDDHEGFRDSSYDSKSSSPEMEGLQHNNDKAENDDGDKNGIDGDENDVEDGEEAESSFSGDADDNNPMDDQALDSASTAAIAGIFTSVQNRSDFPHWSKKPILEDEIRTLLDLARQLAAVTTKENSVWYYWDNKHNGDYLVPYNSTIHDSKDPYDLSSTEVPAANPSDDTLALDAELRKALRKARIRLPASNASSTHASASSFPHPALLENLVAVRKYRGDNTRVKGTGTLGNQYFPHYFSHIPNSGASYGRSLLVSLLRNQSQFLALDEGDRFHACNMGTSGLGSFKTWKGHYKGTTCTMWMTEKKGRAPQTTSM